MSLHVPIYVLMYLKQGTHPFDFFCSIEQTFTNGIYFRHEQERLWTSFRYAFPFLQCIYYMH